MGLQRGVHAAHGPANDLEHPTSVWCSSTCQAEADYTIDERPETADTRPVQQHMAEPTLTPRSANDPDTRQVASTYEGQRWPLSSSE